MERAVGFCGFGSLSSLSSRWWWWWCALVPGVEEQALCGRVVNVMQEEKWGLVVIALLSIARIKKHNYREELCTESNYQLRLAIT